MKLLIHDANILIDLIKTESIGQFFSLEYEMITTLAVIEELNDDQQIIIAELRESSRLKIRSISEKEDEIIEGLLTQNPALSYPDCTVFYSAQVLQATLLTGDKKLRSCAEEKGIDVRGIFWIFDEMLKAKQFTRSEYKEKLSKLKMINRRLPEDEFEKRK
jgi:predicted nucleic acid-binding protein